MVDQLILAESRAMAERAGVPRRNWFDENLGLDRPTEAVFNQALKVLESLGAEIIDIDGKSFSLARKANQAILVCDACAYHEKTMRGTPMKFGGSVRRRILKGAFLSAADSLPLPCGFTDGNLPAALQIVAPPTEETIFFPRRLRLRASDGVA